MIIIKVIKIYQSARLKRGILQESSFLSFVMRDERDIYEPAERLDSPAARWTFYVSRYLCVCVLGIDYYYAR